MWPTTCCLLQLVDIPNECQVLSLLNGDLMEEVYVEQPPCFDISGQEGMVYRMKKASYGFKQVPKAWYKKVYSFFISCMRTIFCWQQSLMSFFQDGLMSYSLCRWLTNYGFLWGQDRAASQWVKNDIWNDRFRTSTLLLGHGGLSITWMHISQPA